MRKTYILLISVVSILILLIGYSSSNVYTLKRGRVIWTKQVIEIPSEYPIALNFSRYEELSNSTGLSLNYELYRGDEPLYPVKSSEHFYTYEVGLNDEVTLVIKLGNPNNFTSYIFLYLGIERDDQELLNYYLNDSIDVKFYGLEEPFSGEMIGQPVNIIHDFKPGLIVLKPNQYETLTYHIRIINSGKRGYYPIEIIVVPFRMVNGKLLPFDCWSFPIAFQVKH